MQLYYRELRRRAKNLQQHYTPEPEILPTLVISDEHGLPVWVCIPTKFDWRPTEGEPIPPKILALVEPEVRAAYEARLAAERGGTAGDALAQDIVAEDTAADERAAQDRAVENGGPGGLGRSSLVGAGRERSTLSS